jgi:tetratricopeptide (TPR) repeat protein
LFSIAAFYIGSFGFMPRAVFLSYASQDADMAKTICDALRAAGIEVWFDQSELVGGDAWDKSIREQIAECSLFIPLLSAITQARREAYFRLEWKLADERTHLMAEGTPFIVPVSLDHTNDKGALVPKSFLSVQWTKLPGGVVNEAFVERIGRLLGTPETSGSFAKTPPSSTVTSSRESPKANRWPLWLGVGALIAAALGAGIAMHPRAGGVAEHLDAPKATESRELARKALQLIVSTPEPIRTNLDVATTYCRRAVEIDPTDPEVLAASSEVDTWYLAERFDSSSARGESARTKANQAVAIEPMSFEARYARALFLVMGEGFDTLPAFAGPAEKQLRDLLSERPGEPRVLLTLGHYLRFDHRIDESIRVLEQLAQNPDPKWKASAYNAIAWGLGLNGRYDESLDAAAKSLAAMPFFANVSIGVQYAVRWGGDMDLAKRFMKEIPPAEQMEDYSESCALLVAYWDRDGKQMLKILNSIPSEWLASMAFQGPKGLWEGKAEMMIGNPEAARLCWNGALKMVDERIATDPTSANLLANKARLLASLDRDEEANQTMNLARQLGSNEWLPSLLNPNEVIAELRKDKSSWAVLKLDPDLDFIRPNPKFQELLLEAEKDPLRSRHAK